MVLSTSFTRAFNLTVPVCLAPMAGVSGGRLAGERKDRESQCVCFLSRLLCISHSVPGAAVGDSCSTSSMLGCAGRSNNARDCSMEPAMKALRVCSCVRWLKRATSNGRDARMIPAWWKQVCMRFLARAADRTQGSSIFLHYSSASSSGHKNPETGTAQQQEHCCRRSFCFRASVIHVCQRGLYHVISKTDELDAGACQRRTAFARRAKQQPYPFSFCHIIRPCFRARLCSLSFCGQAGALVCSVKVKVKDPARII